MEHIDWSSRERCLIAELRETAKKEGSRIMDRAADALERTLDRAERAEEALRRTADHLYREKESRYTGPITGA